MMFAETRKLNLIEQVLKINDEHTLAALETVIKKTPKKQESIKNSFAAQSGIWSKEEADEITKAISEGCDQINPDDWK